MAELGSGIDKFIGVLDRTWGLVAAVEPVRGGVRPSDVLAARDAIQRMVSERNGRLDPAALEPDVVRLFDTRMAAIYGRAAALAIAADDDAGYADAWLAAAERLAQGDERAEIAAGRQSPERYRALWEGRDRFASGDEGAARRAWRRLAKGEADAIARAARAELDAPRPIGGSVGVPGLWSFNGIGVRFFGRRDARPDRSYVTTHCVTVFFVPLMPLSAWRVRDEAGGFCILARVPLSPLARVLRWAIPAALVLTLAIATLIDQINDPARLARHRWDDALELASRGDAEAALHAIDGELARDLELVDGERAERAGAEVVRLMASYVAAPLVPDKLDAAMRVVHRYEALPRAAQRGAAQTAMLDQLDRWTKQLGDGAPTADANLALLRAAGQIAEGERRREIEARLASLQLRLAAARRDEAPLDALAILVGDPGGHPGPGVIEAADKIVERLCDAPSLLLDAGPDLDVWRSASKSGDRGRADNLRNEAAAGRTAAQAEGVTPKQLAELQVRRTWDQYTAVELARNDMTAGRLDAAAARIAKLGAPGMMIREARLVSAQIAAAQGKLDVADATLSALLSSRLARYTVETSLLQGTFKAVQDRLTAQLTSGQVSPELERKYEAANDSQRKELITQWFEEQMKGDSELTAARARYEAFADVVPTALLAGSIKLRRAQAMSGPARQAMLEDAERTFLAIRLEAEGQPQFRLALGEIYARLGKTAESEAEFKAVLDKHDPALGLMVSRVYRDIGSVARAKQVAKDVFEAADAPIKEQAATLLGLLSVGVDDDEAAAWYGKGDKTSLFIRAALLEIEGRKLARAGKDAECAAKFAEAAKIFVSVGNAGDVSGFNNAAVAYNQGFHCSGDLQLTRAAVAALETASRRVPEDAIVTANLGHALALTGNFRVLARHVDVRALRLGDEHARTLLDQLLDGPERSVLLGELAADPSLRRAGEVLAQYELLAPNHPGGYHARFRDAARKGDAEAAAAVLERARHTKALDVSEAVAARARWLSGADDAERLAAMTSELARREAVVAGPAFERLDARTRAAGLYLLAGTLSALGLEKAEVAMVVRAQDVAAQAARLWPALDSNAIVVQARLDQAGVEGDAKAWRAVRKERGAMSALDQLVSKRDPLADKIRASKQFPDAAALAKASLRRPSVGELRFARLVGDPAFEAAAKAVLDDKLTRLELELDVVLDPSNQVAKDDLAYLDRR